MRALVLSLATSFGLHGVVVAGVIGVGGGPARTAAPAITLIDVSLAEPADLPRAQAPSAGESATISPARRPRVSFAGSKRTMAPQPTESPPVHGLSDDGASGAEDLPLGAAGEVASPTSAGATPTAESVAGCAGGETRPPGAHTGDAPTYPMAARASGVQGTTRVRLFVSVAGTVTAAVVMQSSGSRLLDDAAVASLLRWRFQPALRNGEPVAAEVVVPVVFSLR